MKTRLSLLLCVFLLVSQTSCTQVKSAEEQAVKLVAKYFPAGLFPSSKKKPSAKDKDKKDAKKAAEGAGKAEVARADAPKSAAAPTDTAPAAVVPSAEPAELTIPAATSVATTPVAPATPLRDYTPTPLVPNNTLPITPTDHVGGAVTGMGVSENQVYFGLGRRLAVYDSQLNSLGVANLNGVIQDVTSISGSDGSYIFVKEVGNVLEILKLATGGPLAVVKSFKIEGPFEGPFAMTSGTAKSFQMIVELSDKIQILDVSQPSAIKVIAELPVTQASQIWPMGAFLYIAHGKTLQVVNAASGATLASVPVDSEFKILGTQSEGDKTFLLAALKSAKTGKWQTIQYMPLSAGGGGIADLGQGVELVGGADDVRSDLYKPGLALLRDGKLSLFDVTRKVEVTSPSLSVTGLKQVRAGNGVYYVVGASGFGRFEFEAADAGATPPAAGAPLAAGAAPSGRWVKDKVMPNPWNVEAIMLPGQDTLLVAGSKTQDISSALFLARGMLAGMKDLSLVPATLTVPPHYTLARAGSAGVYYYDEVSMKIVLLKKDYSSADILETGGLPLTGLDVASGSKGDVLYVTTSRAGANAIQVLSVPAGSHDLKSLASLPLDEAGGVRLFNKSQRALVACGAKGVCAIDLDSDNPKMKLLTTIAPVHKGGKVTEVVVSPDENLAYLFFEGDSGKIISIVNLRLAPPAEIAVIPQVAMDRSQFRNLSFAAGGQKIILPDDNGVSVYDLKDPKKPVLSFQWPVGRALGVDVTNRGKTLCVALGEGGVECGNFSTTPQSLPPK